MQREEIDIWMPIKVNVIKATLAICTIELYQYIGERDANMHT